MPQEINSLATLDYGTRSTQSIIAFQFCYDMRRRRLLPTDIPRLVRPNGPISRTFRHQLSGSARAWRTHPTTASVREGPVRAFHCLVQICVCVESVVGCTARFSISLETVIVACRVVSHLLYE